MSDDSKLARELADRLEASRWISQHELTVVIPRLLRAWPDTYQRGFDAGYSAGHEDQMKGTYMSRFNIICSCIGFFGMCACLLAIFFWGVWRIWVEIHPLAAVVFFFFMASFAIALLGTCPDGDDE